VHQHRATHWLDHEAASSPCHNREDVQNFNDYLHDHVNHRISWWWHFHERFEVFEEILDTLEEIN